MSDILQQAPARTLAVVANPSAMGFFGRAMVTLMASIQKLDITSGKARALHWTTFILIDLLFLGLPLSLLSAAKECFRAFAGRSEQALAISSRYAAGAEWGLFRW